MPIASYFYDGSRDFLFCFAFKLYIILVNFQGNLLKVFKMDKLEVYINDVKDSDILKEAKSLRQTPAVTDS